MKLGFFSLRTGIVRSLTITIASGLGVILLLVLGLMWWWDHEPAVFDVVESAEQHASTHGGSTVSGYVFTHTVSALAAKLLDKRGGYLSNDVMVPGVIMDNVPNWEFGVLTQIRDAGRSLRKDFSRAQSQSLENPDLAEAEGKFFYDNSSWLLPRTEDEYRNGIEYVDSYLQGLASQNDPYTQFFARADNLRAWLENVSTRLGSLSQSLSESVGKNQISLGLAGDPSARSATTEAPDEHLRTPWTQVDDIFYEARGQTWALLHLLRAVEHDFEPVLKDKNALVSLRQIINDLEATQVSLWSPVILNGDGFGFLANHSMVMAAYVARVNAAIIDLQILLQQG